MSVAENIIPSLPYWRCVFNVALLHIVVAVKSHNERTLLYWYSIALVTGEDTGNSLELFIKINSNRSVVI